MDMFSFLDAVFTLSIGKPFLAYRIRISASYTSASKSYLTHPYLSSGKDKNLAFSCLIYTGCMGHHDMPSLRLMSQNVIRH